MVFFNIALPVFLMFSFPILLWILNKRPFYIKQPGLRFKIATTLIMLFWVVTLFSSQTQLWYWIANLLLLSAFLIFAFMVWSVLCWGYTIRMLLVLNANSNSLNFVEWQKMHAKPSGIQNLTLNRIQFLEKLYLVRSDSHQIIICKKGLYLAKIAQIFMKLFGVSL